MEYVWSCLYVVVGLSLHDGSTSLQDLDFLPSVDQAIMIGTKHRSRFLYSMGAVSSPRALGINHGVG